MSSQSEVRLGTIRLNGHAGRSRSWPMRYGPRRPGRLLRDLEPGRLVQGDNELGENLIAEAATLEVDQTRRGRVFW